MNINTVNISIDTKIHKSTIISTRSRGLPLLAPVALCGRRAASSPRRCLLFSASSELSAYYRVIVIVIVIVIEIVIIIMIVMIM